MSCPPAIESATARPSGGAPSSEMADCWIFDLDNTLYPASSDIFGQIDRRMGQFIQGLLGLDAGSARRLQKQYYREHGTTMRGLMDRHGVEPTVFLDYVHRIDLSILEADPKLDAALAALPGRKLIFTNASQAHAARVTERLGICHHFEAVFDIAAAEFQPKPRHQAYALLIEHHRIAPTRAVFFEDSAHNLEPAAALGMTTVWLRPAAPRDEETPTAPFIDHVVDDLVTWLRMLTDGHGGGTAGR